MPIALGAPLGQISDDETATLEHAESLLEAGEVQTAEVAFRRLLIEQPGSGEALMGWARALIAQDRGATALAPLTAAAERRSEAGLYQEEIVLLELAAQISPDDGGLAARLGRAYLLDQQFVAAQDQLRRALALGVGGPDVLLPLAAALWENGELDEADRTYRLAAARAPSSPVVHYQLGRFLLWQGDFEPAVQELRRAGELGDRGLDYVLDLARALEGRARELAGSETRADLLADLLAQARQAFELAVEMAPEHSEARYGLSRILMLQGEDEAARKQLDVYRELYREDHESTRSRQRLEAEIKLSQRLVVEGRARDAVAQLESLPETPDSLRALALAHRSLGAVDQAREVLERAVLMAPERTDLQALLVELRRQPDHDATGVP